MECLNLNLKFDIICCILVLNKNKKYAITTKKKKKRKKYPTNPCKYCQLQGMQQKKIINVIQNTNVKIYGNMEKC